uniref:Uncharacterized protein n=1 Tax=Arundo donax TaxID=35708 RepID=A0A0A9F738_ARUDO
MFFEEHEDYKVGVAIKFCFFFSELTKRKIICSSNNIMDYVCAVQRSGMALLGSSYM